MDKSRPRPGTLRSVWRTVSMPVLGETDSPRFEKYWPNGTIPFPSPGLGVAANWDQTDGIGIPAYIRLQKGEHASTQISEILLAFVAPVAASSHEMFTGTFRFVTDEFAA